MSYTMILAQKIEPNLHMTLLTDSIYRDFMELQWSDPISRQNSAPRTNGYLATLAHWVRG